MASAGISLLFFLLALEGFTEAGKSSKGTKDDIAGPYQIVIHSIKDLNKNYKEYVEWTLRVTKKDKKGPPFLEGSMHFLKEIRGLEHDMEVYQKDTSVGQGDKWNKYNVNEMKSGSICMNVIQLIFFNQFKGFKPEFPCTLKPKKMELTPIDINEKLHTVMEKAEYGMFKVDLKYWIKDPTLPKGKEPPYVIRFEVIVSVQKA